MRNESMLSGETLGHDRREGRKKERKIIKIKVKRQEELSEACCFKSPQPGTSSTKSHRTDYLPCPLLVGTLCAPQYP